MKLSRFLQDVVSERPSQGMCGCESPWLRVGDVDLSLEKIALGDSSSTARKKAGSSYKLQHGRYHVDIKVVAYASDRRVSRFRICSEDLAPSLGRRLGNIGVDSACIVAWDAPYAGDFRIRRDQWMKEVETAQRRLWPSPSQNKLCIVAKTGVARRKLILVQTGFGDGSFPIHELRRAGRRVGLELLFINPGTRYPFEVEQSPPVDDQVKADQELHWSLIENYWDGAWAAFKKGSETTRAYFGQLSPGRRALLALDIFHKRLARGSLYVFCTMQQAGDVLIDEILSGYKLLRAKEYVERFEVVHTLCREAAGIADLRAKIAAVDAVFSRDNLKRLIEFQEWFMGADKDPRLRIEPLLRAYVESQREDFKN